MSFSQTCAVAVNNTYGTTGTVTRAAIATLSPAEILALFQPVAGTPGKWAELDSLLKHQIEMTACGVVRSPLYDWIMSSNKPGQGALVSIHRVAKGPSLVQPFILGLQKSVWNQDYWTVKAGLTAVAYNDVGNLDKPLGAVTGYVLRLTNVFGSLHADYFQPRQTLIVINKSGVDGAYQISRFRVVKAATGADPVHVDVEAVFEQATTPFPDDEIPPVPSVGSILPSTATPTDGLVLQGINNVHDAEAWCYNRHNVNLNKLVPFWYQTYRNQRAVDSEYQKVFAHLMAQNAYYAKFMDLPLAERNRQDERFARVEFMNSFFFGERISNNQTIDSWKTLDQILSATSAAVDVGIGAQLMGYRANMVGVVPQLAACGQVWDLAEQDVPIKTLLETYLYDITRARQSSGRPHGEIDIYTNSVSADEFMQAFIAYSNEKVGGLLQININEGQTPIGFPYRKFKLYIPAGVTVNVMTDPFFDDMRTAAMMSAATNYFGNYLMILDIGSGGTIYPAILASNRKVYTVGELDNLARIDNTYSCVMSLPTRTRTLTSQTCTAVVECPYNSLVVVNYKSIVHVAAGVLAAQAQQLQGQLAEARKSKLIEPGKTEVVVEPAKPVKDKAAK